jgi:hypothetical protein
MTARNQLEVVDVIGPMFSVRSAPFRDVCYPMPREHLLASRALLKPQATHRRFRLALPLGMPLLAAAGRYGEVGYR